MFRHFFALMLFVSATPLLAEELSKEESCRYQGLVMSAVQQARLDRVKKADVEQVIRASNPPWPDEVSNAIPPLVNHVYAMKRRDVRRNDLGPMLEQQCVENWDQIQAMKNSLNN